MSCQIQYDVMILCACAEGYYKENADKFNFFQYEIVDAGEREAQFLSDHPEARDFIWVNVLIETKKRSAVKITEKHLGEKHANKL